MDKKIYNLVLPESLFDEDTESYIHYRGSCIIADNCLYLTKGDSFSTDTYHNYICLQKLEVLTNYSNFYLTFHGIGECIIELFVTNPEDYYTYDKRILTKKINLEQEIKINIPSGLKLCYCRITALSDCKLSGGELWGNLDKEREISIAYCICSYNRETYVKNFVDTVASKYIDNNNIRFFISVNGDEYDISYPANMISIKNRNLGGSGGFTRAIVESLKDNFTHIILADDDILIKNFVIDKTIAILKGLRDEYLDSFISGAMLSLEQRWLQYEKTCKLSNNGFEHEGLNLDTRVRECVVRDILNMPQTGLAAWWYCVIPVPIIKEYKLPLPIFVRGDDVEFSVRCSKRIITFNGICVWHEPFSKKYNEIMEDYYLVRNMVIISYLYGNSYKGLRDQFFCKKFMQNLLCFDYVAAECNLLAIESILNKEYYTDPADLHVSITQKVKAQVCKIPSWQGERLLINVHKKQTVLKKAKRFLRLLLQYFIGISHGKGICYGGFGKVKERFIGKKRVVTYHGNGVYRLYKFKYKVAWILLIKYIYLLVMLKIKDSQIEKDLHTFKNSSSSIDFWENLLKKQ